MTTQDNLNELAQRVHELAEIVLSQKEAIETLEATQLRTLELLKREAEGNKTHTLLTSTVVDRLLVLEGKVNGIT